MAHALETVDYSSGRGRGVLLASVLGSSMAFLDSTAVNVALHVLDEELGAGLSGLQWTVDAYLLTLGALVLTGGALGDAFGQRRIFLTGLGAFAATSMLCGLAPSVGFLAAARAAQGLGAALLVPTSLALLRTSFSEKDRDRAVTAWAGLSGVSTAVGPLLGGWLIGLWSWRAVFFLNLPLAVLSAWAGRRFVPAIAPARSARELDYGGALSATLGLAGIVFALIEGPVHGWSPLSLSAGVGGVLSLGLFVLLQARGRHPMLPLSIFRSRAFAGANITTLAVYFALGGATFFIVLALQQEVGYSPLEAGAALLPITALMLLLSPSMGGLMQRMGARLPMTLGPLVCAVGLLLFTRIERGGSYVGSVLPGAVGLGLGLVLTVGPLTATVLDSVPGNQAGIASGFNNAVARIAGLLAVALLPVASGLATHPGMDFLVGVHRALWLSAALCGVGAVCSWVFIPGRRHGDTSRPG
ncbi:DHA2 family efflux MFS transporter permease subunit [Vitiosangium sp. GDMCC 1.1324]|uniref:DHA2 family efflux MFS transporter permease subunit n=1 Tax=Vitiosangium sp. (strain GDMCC 1.1324) TaxID=2138576 RepID=UPI000D34AB80|nr:DHA2 family efflux MFS transporter permease subunit [Vitiosangium sp. GDMCC 1.1324]PTL84694.1 MFS transporter [Vitiosangium sp. GDMCC 1.1324]